MVPKKNVFISGFVNTCPFSRKYKNLPPFRMITVLSNIWIFCKYRFHRLGASNEQHHSMLRLARASYSLYKVNDVFIWYVIWINVTNGISRLFLRKKIRDFRCNCSTMTFWSIHSTNLSFFQSPSIVMYRISSKMPGMCLTSLL